MYPQSHFLVPFLIGEVFVQLGGFSHTGAVIAGIIGMFVDIDHFIEFFFHHKVLSIRKSWNNAVLTKEKCPRTFVHRTSGCLITTALIAGLFMINKNNVAFALGLGYYTHMLLDSFDAYSIGRVFKIKMRGFVMKISLFEIVFDIILLLVTIMIMAMIE